jgi:hypothetical protein
MTFLNPAVLFALVAAAIPVLLHLLNLRRLRTVEFSTLAFLKQLEKNKMRRLKLRQIVLLILRTLVIACLVIAFARPALRGTTAAGLGTRAKTTAVLLFDDSFSMSAMDERGPLINQAKSASLNLLSLLKEGDDVFFQRFSEGSGPGTPEAPTHNISGVRSAIDETGISYAFHSLEDVLQRTERVLKESKNFSKEIYFVTDLQKTNFDQGERQASSSATPLTLEFDNQTRLFLVQVGHASVANAAVEAIETESRIFEKDRPFSLKATLRNYSTTPLRNNTVSLYLDGTRVMQKSIDIPPEAAAVTEFVGTPKRTGFVSGYVQTEPDAIDQDNERYFTVFIPERTRILFVTSSPRDIYYLSLALTAGKQTQSSDEIQTTTPTKLVTTPLSRYDVIIIANVKSLGAEEVEQLRQFVVNGGGMIFFPGSAVDVSQYAAVFCEKMNIAPFLGKLGRGSDRNSFLSFESVDFAHPLFSGMFEAKGSSEKNRTPAYRKGRPSIESPHISETLQYHPGRNGESVIRLSNGTPFLTDYRIGNGRLLLYSVPATLDWSDFPVKGIFVPLIRRSVAYLASLGEQPADHLAGKAVDVALPSRVFEATQGSNVVHKSPDGDEEIIRPNENGRGGEQLFVIKKTGTPGIHEIVSNKEILSAFSVNVDPRESDTRRLTIDEAKEWVSKHGLRAGAIKALDPNEHPDAVVLQSRFGIELWKYFLGIAIACALTEMMVARSRRKAGEVREQ